MDHRKLGRTTEHRIAMLRNQAVSLMKHDRIRTTLEKAKELKRFVEKLITLAKEDTLHSRRMAARHVHDPAALKKLFATLGPLYAQRPGGYTRILKLGDRKGDGAQLAIVELVDREPKFEDKTKKAKKAKAKGEPKEAQAAEPEAEEKNPRKRAAKAEEEEAADTQPAAEPESSEPKPQE
jgi:large subunit ribosomal protein L17